MVPILVVAMAVPVVAVVVPVASWLSKTGMLA